MPQTKETVPHLQEQRVEVAKTITLERVSERSMVQIVHVPVPLHAEVLVEAMPLVPQERFQQHTGEQTIVDIVNYISQTREEVAKVL